MTDPVSPIRALVETAARALPADRLARAQEAERAAAAALGRQEVVMLALVDLRRQAAALRAIAEREAER